MARGRWLELLLAAASACSTLACGRDEAVASTCLPIIGGVPDPEHGAVMALVDSFGVLTCAATLVGAAEGRSVLLTAAHCLETVASRIVSGSDYSAPLQSEAIVDALSHPRFERSTGVFDFALIFSDAPFTDVTPIPLARPEADGLAAGSQVRFVGFGDTEEGVPDPLKRSAPGTLDVLDQNSFEYAQDEAGPCFGDSGGPALSVQQGVELVVGVTSFGDRGCHSRGTSARASAAFDFVQAVITPPACPVDSGL